MLRLSEDLAIEVHRDNQEASKDIKDDLNTSLSNKGVII
jgi:hypothetical protein